MYADTWPQHRTRAHSQCRFREKQVGLSSVVFWSWDVMHFSGVGEVSLGKSRLSGVQRDRMVR